MTETTVRNRNLPEALEEFILRWGDMGGQWSVNRSVGQIHALLYVEEAPLTAEDIAETLGIARSNVSNSLKELMAWNLVRRVPVKADRRDHYEAETDVWEIAARIAAGRKAREIDPALEALSICVTKSETDKAVSPEIRRRIKAMHDFTQSVDRWYGQMLGLSKGKREMLLKLGGKVVSLLPGGRE